MKQGLLLVIKRLDVVVFSDNLLFYISLFRLLGFPQSISVDLILETAQTKAVIREEIGAQVEHGIVVEQEQGVFKRGKILRRSPNVSVISKKVEGTTGVSISRIERFCGNVFIPPWRVVRKNEGEDTRELKP